MKRISIILFTAFLFVSFSCSENKSSDENSTDSPAQTEISSTELQATTVSDTPAVQALQMENGSAPATIIQQSNPSAPAAVKAGEALNPAHGQPGHDCSISVGAPLSTGQLAKGGSATSPAANPAPGSPVANPTPSASPIVPVQGQTGTGTAAPGTTAPGMNPPHGEPGHDCAKPVGAPLK